MFYSNPEEQKKHEEFLANLKVGDTVAHRSDNKWNNTPRKAVVTKITPTRRITVQAEGLSIESVFLKGGERRVGGSWGSTEWIEPWTPETEALIKHMALLARAQQWLNMGAISANKLNALKDEELESIILLCRKLKKDES